MTRFDRIPGESVDPIPRLAWLGQGPAIRAGTGADRGSYEAVRPIHPQHPRVITVRETARLQGFPDKHRFHPTLWYSFGRIGNGLSPLIERVIWDAISKRLASKTTVSLAAE